MLRTAESDFETAETLLKSKRNLHHCLFFCHLVVEKHLKALVVKETGDCAPKTHDLEYLMRKAKLDLSSEDISFLNELTKFNLEARYPDGKLKSYKAATRQTAERLYMKSKEFTPWARNLAKHIYGVPPDGSDIDLAIVSRAA